MDLISQEIRAGCKSKVKSVDANGNQIESTEKQPANFNESPDTVDEELEAQLRRVRLESDKKSESPQVQPESDEIGDDAEDDVVKRNDDLEKTEEVIKETNDQTTLVQSEEGRFTKMMSKSWKLFGLEFAPIVLPLERRLQTLAVIMWLWLALCLGSCATGVLGYMLVYTQFWWIPLAYFTWMIADRKSPQQGGRSAKVKEWVRGWSLWKYYANYFPIRLVKTADLDPSQNYLFGSHPHGILSSGTFGALSTDGVGVSSIFPKFQVNVHTLALNFMFPITREWILGLGGVDASKQSISYLLSKPGGHISVIVVGGAAESLHTSPNQISLVLKNRKGFVKMALKHGAQLVPTFSFGEAQIYTVVDNPKGSWLRNLQEKFRHLIGFAPVFFFGRGVFNYSLGLIPRRRPIYVVTGSPIKVPKSPNPTVEEIEQVHAEYTAALKQLYNKYNPVYGDTNVSLNIM